MNAFESIVWVAGGQAKGTNFDDLVTQQAPPACGARCCSGGWTVP